MQYNIPCLICDSQDHESDECPNLEREYQKLIMGLLNTTDNQAQNNSNMVWINTTDIISILDKLKKENWNTRNGQVYNQILKMVKEEIKRLEPT